MPYPTAVLIFSTLNKGRLNADLRTQQVFPLVIGGVPRERHRGLIERDFATPARVSVDCAIIVETAPPHWALHASRLPFGQKRKNAGSADGHPVMCDISSDQQALKTIDAY